MPPRKRPAACLPEGAGEHKRTPSGPFDALKGKQLFFVPEQILGAAQRTKSNSAEHPYDATKEKWEVFKVKWRDHPASANSWE